uniref:Avidin n=1 Tax=Sinocyclocheilus anshuiensis TaxID=1608454 RepID=A0A671QCW1_9TELE
MTHCVPQFWTKMSSLMWHLLFVTLITSGMVSANDSSALNMKASSCNITGFWRNELGSTLRVKAEGSEVRGVYQTTVESKRGTAGLHRTARIIGIVGNGTQPAVSFSVLWEKGKTDNLTGDWGSTR